MGTHGYLASLRAQIIFSGIFLLLTQSAKAATYTPRSFFVTGSFSFDVISPGALNDLTLGTAKLPGLIGGRLRVERGLFAPDWTHWLELAYFKGSAEASGEAGTFGQNLSYWTVIPVGASYWFLRSAFIDFGIGAGVGLGLAPSYTLNATPAAGSATATIQNFTGKLGPVAAARIEARFWLGKSFAATFASGLHVFSSELTTADAPATTVQGALTGLSIIGGLTYAFGGVQGTGRTYVEVIRDKPDVQPAVKPVAKPPAPAPTAPSAAPPKSGR